MRKRTLCNERYLRLAFNQTVFGFSTVLKGIAICQSLVELFFLLRFLRSKFFRTCRRCKIAVQGGFEVNKK